MDDDWRRVFCPRYADNADIGKKRAAPDLREINNRPRQFFPDDANRLFL